MASPTITATTESNKGSSSTSISVGTGSPLEGEGVLVFVSWDGGTGTVSFSDGYTELYDSNDDDGVADGAAAYKQAGASEPANITVTCTATTRFAAVCFRVSGHLSFSTQAPDFAIVTNEGNTVTHDPPNKSVTGGSADILVFAPCAYDTYTSSVSTYPSSYTGTGTVQSGTSGAQCSMAYCSRALTAASENPGAYTLSATRRAVVGTVIIQAAAAGGTNPKGIFGMPLNRPLRGPL